MKKKRIAIIGAGELGCQINNIIKEIPQIIVVGFFDDLKTPVKTKGQIFIQPLESIDSLYEQNEYDELIIGIGYKHFRLRQNIFEKYKTKIPFARIIHPSSIVDKNATIAEGTVLYPGVILDKGVIIEENVILNLGCCIAHDTKIGAHSFLAPRVTIAGFSKIGKRCFIGINATCIDSVHICDDVTIGAASLVLCNIENPGVYYGHPIKQ